MNTLKKRINKKEVKEKQFNNTFNLNKENYFKYNLNLNYKNNHIESENAIMSHDNLHNNIKTPIKNIKFHIKNNDDILNEINKELNKENASEIYKKKVIKLFENFFIYLIDVKKNKELKNNFEIFQKYIIKRIKITDVEDFINDKYKDSKPSTIANLKSRMRKFIRIINKEPNLDYSQKIIRPKIIRDSSLFSNEELFFLLNNLKKKMILCHYY